MVRVSSPFKGFSGLFQSCLWERIVLFMLRIGGRFKAIPLFTFCNSCPSICCQVSCVVKARLWRLLLYFLIFNPLDPLRTNGRLLSIHIGPADIQKGLTLDVQWTYQTKRNIFVKTGLIQTSVLVFWGFLCTIPGVQIIPVCWTSLRCPFDDYSQIANM